MTDERYTFEQARVRLEEIAAEVRKKDVSLEQSLDLLEEGVRLANICTELVDHTDLSASVVAAAPDTGPEDGIDESASTAHEDVLAEHTEAATDAGAGDAVSMEVEQDADARTGDSAP